MKTKEGLIYMKMFKEWVMEEGGIWYFIGIGVCLFGLVFCMHGYKIDRDRIDRKYGVRELVSYSRLHLKEGFYEYSDFNIIVTGFGYNDIAFYDKENNFIYKVGTYTNEYDDEKYDMIVDMCNEVEFKTVKSNKED